MKQLSQEEIKEILLSQQYVSQEDFSAAQEQSELAGASIVQYLVDTQALSYDLYGQAVAEYFKMSYVDFDAHPVTEKTTELVSKSTATKKRVIFVYEDDKKAVYATDIPGQKGLEDKFKKNHSKKKIVVAYALGQGIDKGLFLYRDSVSDVVEKILKKDPENAPEVIDVLFTEAVNRKASDMHFEPQKEFVVVRFRIDGFLEEVIRFERELYAIVLNRIKVLSDLRIDKHFSSQDGSLHYESPAISVDMRVSIVPIIDGEKIVIRILGEYVKGLSLQDIGMTGNDLVIAEEAARKPFGMILVTGPTGSGKTTTLYSIVKLLNKPGVNIMTIEDPVEYKIPGINQIQVNEQAELTFAKGLRSVVRQDPDIILVGEIRDKETAEIAVNAALTGHLVISTFHANDAATAIPRLLDMGIEPFLLASTLELVVGQRLVRVLKEDQRISKTYTKDDLSEKYKELEPFFKEGVHTFYEPKENSESPFSGRTAIFELLPITNQLENLVMKNPSASEIWEVARKQGVTSMFEDGIRKLKLGITTPQELLRVVEPPSFNES